MDDPWQFLILDRHTATDKDVKAAYARLLKQHRPDQDPEGFQKLRQAYEAALAAVARRDAGQAEETQPSYAAPEPSAKVKAEAASGSLPFREGMLPVAVQEAFSTLQHSVGSGNEEQMQAAVAAFQAACASANVPASLLAQALQDAFHSDAPLTARGMTNEIVVYLAEKGEINFCHGVVSAWAMDDQRMRLATLGAALLKRSGLLASQDGATLMARVGMLSGLEFPQVAAPLGNAAFPHLPVEGREQFIGQLEQQVLLGKLFADVSTEVRPFWFRMLRKNAADRDWSSAEAKRAVQSTVEKHRHYWKGWGVVRQLMPPETWAPLERKLREQATGVGSSYGTAKVPNSVAWGVIVGLIFFFAGLANHWGVNQYSSRSTSPLYNYHPPDRVTPNSFKFDHGGSQPNLFDPDLLRRHLSSPTMLNPTLPSAGSVSTFPGSPSHTLAPPELHTDPNNLLSGVPPSTTTPHPATPPPSSSTSIDDVIKRAKENQNVIITLPSGQRVPLSNLTPSGAK